MQKVKFFKYLGAFSVNKNSRTVMQTLTYAAQLLNDPQNLVVIFPQGKLHSNFIEKVNFEKGIIKVIKQADDNFQLVTAVTFVEHLRHKKPSANVYLQTIPPTKFDNITELNDIYQQHYNAARQQQTEIVL
jgi:1-acyl-sn-glycerol-3-phosphate acyltransferase